MNERPVVGCMVVLAVSLMLGALALALGYALAGWLR